MSNAAVSCPRRVVTGHDEQGRSLIRSDGDAPVAIQFGELGPTIFELWRSDVLPASNEGHEDGALLPFTLAPPLGGLIARVVHYPPDRESNWTGEDAMKAFAAHGAGDALSARQERHPAFHKTQSLDLAIVLEGEIWALLDEGETLMKTGDVLVQRGTNHAWANRSDRPCRVCYVAVGAQAPKTA